MPRRRSAKVSILIEQIQLALKDDPNLSIYELSKRLNVSCTRISWAVKSDKLSVRSGFKPVVENMEEFQKDIKDLNKSLP